MASPKSTSSVPDSKAIPKYSLSLTSEVPVEWHFPKVSLIPYVNHPEGRLFFFCVSAKWQQLTTAGGSAEPGESFLDAGTRELKEESMGLFDYTQQLDHIRQHSFTVYSGESLFVFFPVEVDSPTALCEDFRQAYLKSKIDRVADHLVENSHLLWISEVALCRILRGEELVEMPIELNRIFRPSVAPPRRGQLLTTEHCYPSMFYRIRDFLQGVHTAYGVLPGH